MRPLIVLILISSSIAAQDRFDVVIDEIMADPVHRGLPGNEWLELKNTTSLPINLLNWRIGDATSQSGPCPAFILQPDSFVIVCTGTAVAALSVFGATIPVTSFPSLDNDGDQLFLKAANGKRSMPLTILHPGIKMKLKVMADGHLEMIDTNSPCAGSSNWKASMIRVEEHRE